MRSVTFFENKTHPKRSEIWKFLGEAMVKTWEKNPNFKLEIFAIFNFFSNEYFMSNLLKTWRSRELEKFGFAL